MPVRSSFWSDHLGVESAHSESQSRVLWDAGSSRVALGGVCDEAEIRGHRRTYVGARPGRIVRALIEAETMNPVFLLDEMDKVGNDWRGDPSSALLEVLDPAQNHTFHDHYLETDLDLSDVSLQTQQRNVLETIPAPLLDRTEVISIEVSDYLGKPKVWKDEAKDRTDVPGVATGLAVTGAGGDVLFIEATSKAGDRDLILTGQLGDVMKESARIALSYLESRATELSIEPDQIDRSFHLHVPAGAIPKDGPSAGITMTTALASLMTGRKVRGEVGMTGEVTLQGKVLPIGGLKQKVLAAHRAGLTEVIIPRRNEVDIDDIPEAIRNEMTFHVADDMGQVLEWALVK